MQEEYLKDFESWNGYKKSLNSRVADPFYHEREIWWCAIGVNIGSEQDGKNENFERPIIIIRKIRRDLILIAPMTSKIDRHKDRVTIFVDGKKFQILLSQIRVVSSKRLLRRVVRIKTSIFLQVIIRLSKIILDFSENETPP